MENFVRKESLKKSLLNSFDKSKAENQFLLRSVAITNNCEFKDLKFFVYKYKEDDKGTCFCGTSKEFNNNDEERELLFQIAAFTGDNEVFEDIFNRALSELAQKSINVSNHKKIKNIENFEIRYISGSIYKKPTNYQSHVAAVVVNESNYEITTQLYISNVPNPKNRLLITVYNHKGDIIYENYKPKAKKPLWLYAAIQLINKNN